jgi:hypothetical protein
MKCEGECERENYIQHWDIGTFNVGVDIMSEMRRKTVFSHG